MARTDAIARVRPPCAGYITTKLRGSKKNKKGEPERAAWAG